MGGAVSLPAHPAAAQFPMMTSEKLQELAEDIRAQGQLHRVVYFEGQLLDGRNRIAACNLIGVEPKAMTLVECKSPTQYVISANLKRRQLTPIQCAALAVDPTILESFRAEAKARMLAGSVVGGKADSSATKQGSCESKRSLDAPAKKSNAEAIAVAAKAVGVGRDSAYALQRIQREAPEVYEAVKRGEIKTVAEAARVAEETFDDELESEPARASSPSPSVGRGSSSPVGLARRHAKQAAKDANVLALIEQNLGPLEISKQLGCSPGYVQSAKERLGLLRNKDENPLRRITDFAVEFCDTFEMFIAKDVSSWSTATPDNVLELINHLRILQKKTKTLIRRLNKEATGDPE